MQINLTFSRYLENRDPQMFAQMLTEDHYNEIFKDLSGRAKRVIGGLGAALTLATASPKPMPIDTKPAAVQVAASPIVKKIIDHIKKTTGKDISPNSVEMIKPSDIISPGYGKDWEKVKGMAGLAQKTPEKIGDIEIPRTSSADTDVDKLDTLIPVVFMNPSDFPNIGKSTEGFCTFTNDMVKFCVVNSKDNLNTLRHELRHTTQGILGSTSLDDSSDDASYLTDEAEIGVRLAALKLDWYKATGEILKKEDLSFKKLISVFSYMNQNKDKFSSDSMDVMKIFFHYYNLSKKTGKNDKLLAFVKAISNNIDTVVRSQKQYLPNLDLRYPSKTSMS